MIGKTISHYRIIEELGRGSMGVVYKAEDAKLMGPVALEFLPEKLSRRRALETFEREVQAASALSHPHVRTICDIDDADGQHITAMKYLEGKTLKHHIQGKSPQTVEILDLAIQINDGIDAVHARSITHCEHQARQRIRCKKRTARLISFQGGLSCDTRILIICGQS